MRGDIPAALAPLERALTLAEPEGYVRIFVDEGPALAALLQAAAKQGTAPGYVRRLLAAFNTTRAAPANRSVEPLSERELDVLRLLGTDLAGPDIARELRVSLNTLRTQHQEHLRQARGEQPPGSGPPGHGARSVVADLRPVEARRRSRPPGHRVTPKLPCRPWTHGGFRKRGGHHSPAAEA